MRPMRTMGPKIPAGYGRAVALMRRGKVAVLACTALLAVSTSASVACAESHEEEEKEADWLLSVEFEPRSVVTIEAGNFYFQKGQLAPVHSHAAPAIGYIVKGKIFYQVEGERPQLLKEGDAFYEPANRRILHFDNVSATEEAVFMDFNLQRQGEPFIVFEEPLIEPIDRRALPTVTLDGSTIAGVDVRSFALRPAATEELDGEAVLLGYVAKGAIELWLGEGEPQYVAARESFYLPADSSEATIRNVSSEKPAKVVTFHLQQVSAD